MTPFWGNEGRLLHRHSRVEAYLLSVVEGAVLSTIQQKLSAEERVAAFETWSAGHRTTPPLSDYVAGVEKATARTTADPSLRSGGHCFGVAE